MVSQAIGLILVILVSAGTCAAVATSGVLTTPPASPKQGVIISSEELNIYSDQAKTSCCASIDWGEIQQGSNATYSIYIENKGVTAKSLHMSTSNWQPLDARSVLTLSWDREATLMQPGEIIEATFTLEAAWDIGSLDSFSFDITVVAVE